MGYFDEDGRSNWDRMVEGDAYIADDPHLLERIRRGMLLAADYQEAVHAGDPNAREILTDLIGGLGEDSIIRPPLTVDFGDFITIGARTFVNFNLTALDVAPITIGEDCVIGPNVQLLTPTHPLDAQSRRDKIESAEPITIGDNVWLGGGVIVCPGVSIGDNAVVGAGSVVTKDIPANAMAVGNPARVLRVLR